MRWCARSAASVAFVLAGQAFGQGFTNPDFGGGNLNGWLVANTPNGVGAPGSVTLIDIDGPGPLGVSEAATFAVGNAVAQAGNQAGVEMTQILNLTGGTQYTFEFDWSAQRVSGGNNTEGGVFSLIVNGAIVASQAAGTTSAATPKFGHLSAAYTPPSTGAYTVGVRITRPFTVPADLNQYVDNFQPGAPSGSTGACCRTDGSCVVVSAASCASLGGIYRGDGSPCATANCPQPATGACCKFDGSCSLVTAAACAASNGVYRGDNVTCAAANCPAPPPVFYKNCNLTTGATTLNGVAAPAGGLWSECARDTNDPTTANTTAGYTGNGAFRLADDFVVPAGGLNVGYVKVYGYTTGATAPGVTAATLRILDGSPMGAPNVVFGDQTTNRLAFTGFTDIYRTFNTVTPPTCGGPVTAPGTTRRLQEIYIAVNQFLPAGTYWIDYNFTGATFAPPSTSASAIGRQCDPNNSNALQFNATWGPLTDAGQGCAPVPVAQDMYFEILGTPGQNCYANCDGSTTPPILNVNDFICFQTKYAAQDPAANCDESTTPPVLNVNDFICFQTKYAAGCP